MATVKALIWFNTINQYRRIFGNFILPLLVLAVSLIINLLINEDYSRSELPPDVGENCGRFSYCFVERQIQYQNVDNTTQLVQIYSNDGIQMPPGRTLNAFKLQPYSVDAGVILGTDNFGCTREALNLEQSVSCQNLFDRIATAPSIMDYGLILILFYGLTLTELRKEQSNKIHTMLSYLGVSISDYLVAWIVLHFFLSILWGTICCAGYLVKSSQLSSSLLFVWLFVVANNFATALFALFCSKFVKGVIWFLVFILQMVIVYFIVMLMSLNQDGVLSINSPFRHLFLLHPISIARNFQMLFQQAEYSKLGISFSQIDSYYHDDLIPWRYFGTIQAMLGALPVLCVIYIMAYLVKFDFVAVLEKYASRRIIGIQDVPMVENVKVNDGPAGGKTVLSLENLCKVYPGGTSAVENISLTVGEGEVLGLLGKNGAGKSTTMNMIAGFIPPTSGTISVNSFGSSSHFRQMRKQLSFCPQDNLFFPRLTLIEHLKFICLLKDTAEFSVERAEEMLADLNLKAKINNKTDQLSGGEKRRACVAMAYIANSPLVLLDEPTSGVDPATRKILWTFIQKYKSVPAPRTHAGSQSSNITGRAVILTTHLMEEADCLSQRIAIIASGKLKAVASPSRLKQEFGVGYRVKCICSKLRLEKIICDRNFQSDVKLVDIEGENSFCEAELLSDTSLSSEFFPDFFKMLENNNIPHSLVSSSLEDVFLRLTVGPSLQDEVPKSEFNVSDFESKDGSDYTKTSKLILETSADINIAGTSKVKHQEKCMRTDRSWTSRQISNFLSSLYIDGFLLYRNHWLFFSFFALAFLVAPMLFMLLCNLSTAPSNANGENTTVALNLSSVFVQPIRVKLFDVSAEDAKLFEKALPGIEIERDTDIDALSRRYYEYPYAIYSHYPFFIKKTQNENEFSCILNMNFPPSFDFCVIAINNFYHYKNNDKRKFFPLKMNYIVTEGNQKAIISRKVSANSEVSADLAKRICKGNTYGVIMPLLMACLLFYLLRMEQRCVVQRQTQYYRANGRSVIWSLTIRYISLTVPLMIFAQVTMLFANVEKLLDKNGNELLKTGLPVAFTNALFALAGASFALLYVRVFKSIFMLLLPTILLALIFVPMVSNDKDIELTENGKGALWALFGLAYLSPIAIWGCVINWARHNTAVIIWLLQTVVYLMCIFALSLLWHRRLKYFLRRVMKKEKLGTFQRESKSNVLTVSSLKHVYYSWLKWFKLICKCIPDKRTLAVNDISFEVRPGQCYALLGVNGSGKSTTFELVTGGLSVQTGDVRIFGASLSHNPIRVLRKLGYCPQNDAIPGYLQVKQLLHAFCILRGVPRNEREAHKQFFIRQMELESQLHKLVSQCSGGTKRKVSTILAFVGFPKLIVLDESTTGMDPVIRKNVANLISRAKELGSAVLISSHTMEEIENCADIICVMKKGTKKVDGYPKDLQEQYGQFLTLCLKLGKYGGSLNTETSVENEETSLQGSADVKQDLTDHLDFSEEIDRRKKNVLESLREKFKGTEMTNVFEVGSNRLQLFFNIPKLGTKLSDLFALINANKTDWGIEESIVDVCTLENIFMQIAMEDEYIDDNDEPVSETTRDLAVLEVQSSFNV